MNGQTASVHAFLTAFVDFVDAIREWASDGLEAIKRWGLSERKQKDKEGDPKGEFEGMKFSFEVKHTPGYEEGTSGPSSLTFKCTATKEEVVRIERALRTAVARADPEPLAKGKKEGFRDA